MALIRHLVPVMALLCLANAEDNTELTSLQNLVNELKKLSNQARTWNESDQTGGYDQQRNLNEGIERRNKSNDKRFNLVSSGSQSCDREYSGSCYVVVNEYMTWQQASDKCQSMGGKLADISDSQENTVIYELTNGAYQHMWIDGKDEQWEGWWSWQTSGNSFSYTNWYSGEPNNVNNEDCAHMMWDGNGGWNDAQCGSSFGAMCEIKPSQECDGEYSGSCYIVVNEYMTWQQASDKCQSMGAQLADISDSQENTVIYELANGAHQHMWIDGKDEQWEGWWSWQTCGDSFSYTSWYSGEPNNVNNEDCAHMMWDGNGGWNDAQCGSSFGAICEIKPEETEVPVTTSCTHEQDGKCYTLVTDLLTWQGASDRCSGMGAQLVEINDQQESDMVYSIANGARTHLWIDGKDEQWEGWWSWQTSGNSFSYTNWYWGEPNNVNNEDCAHMMWDGNGGWNDAQCSSSFGALCEQAATVKYLLASLVEETDEITDDEVLELLRDDVTDAELAATESAYNTNMDDIRELSDATELQEAIDDMNTPPGEYPPPDLPTVSDIPVEIQAGNDGVVTFNSKRALNAHQRSVGGAIIQLFTTSLSFSTTVYSLVATLEGGCNLEPSICSDRQHIETTIETLESEAQSLENKHMQLQRDYVAMRQVMVDNEFLLLYLQNMLESIGNMNTHLRGVQLQLQLTDDELTGISNLAEASAETIINQLFGSIDMTMDSVNKIVEEAQDEAWHDFKVSIAKKIATKIFTSIIVPWVTDSFEEASDILKLKPEFQETEEFRRMAKAYDAFKGNPFEEVDESLKAEIKSGLKKLKVAYADLEYVYKEGVVKDTLKTMSTKPGKFLKLTKQRILSPRDTVKELKNAVTEKVNKVLTGLKAKYELLRQKEYRTFIQHVAGFKRWNELEGFDKVKAVGKVTVSALSAVYTVTTSIISIRQTNQDWAEVAEKMAAERVKYDNLLTETRTKISDIDAKYELLQTSWSDVIYAFKEIATGIKDVLNDATSIDELMANGELGFEVDPNDPTFQPGYYDNMNKDNVRTKQLATLEYIVPLKTGFYSMEEINRGVYLFTVDVNSLTSQGRTVNDILIMIQGVMRQFEAQDVKLYGDIMTKRDIVCAIALSSKPTDAYYDGYELGPLRRNKCTISDAEWNRIENGAPRGRFDQKIADLIEDLIASKSEVSSMLAVVQAFYQNNPNAELSSFILALSEKDILCTVAEYNNDPYYDLYEMSLYSNTACPDITATQAASSKAEADRLRASYATVSSIVQYCSAYSYCLCPSVSEFDFKILANKADPELVQYCVNQNANSCAISCVTITEP